MFFVQVQIWCQKTKHIKIILTQQSTECWNNTVYVYIKFSVVLNERWIKFRYRWLFCDINWETSFDRFFEEIISWIANKNCFRFQKINDCLLWMLFHFNTRSFVFDRIHYVFQNTNKIFCLFLIDSRYYLWIYINYFNQGKTRWTSYISDKELEEMLLLYANAIGYFVWFIK